MLRDDILFTLKDGREALLRCPTEADIEGTIDYLNVTAGESDFVLRTPEECNIYTITGVKSNAIRQPDGTMRNLYMMILEL